MADEEAVIVFRADTEMLRDADGDCDIGALAENFEADADSETTGLLDDEPDCASETRALREIDGDELSDDLLDQLGLADSVSSIDGVTDGDLDTKELFDASAEAVRETDGDADDVFETETDFETSAEDETVSDGDPEAHHDAEAETVGIEGVGFALCELAREALGVKETLSDGDLDSVLDTDGSVDADDGID